MEPVPRYAAASTPFRTDRRAVLRVPTGCPSGGTWVRWRQGGVAVTSERCHEAGSPICPRCHETLRGAVTLTSHHRRLSITVSSKLLASTGTTVGVVCRAVVRPPGTGPVPVAAGSRSGASSEQRRVQCTKFCAILQCSTKYCVMVHVACANVGRVPRVPLVELGARLPCVPVI